MKFKLIQALIVVLIACKNEEDPLKIESTRVVTTFLRQVFSETFFSVWALLGHKVPLGLSI